ncbi:MAG: rRNA maturation RNase YbeY [Planctomycetales bacterium]|nr:rRNA maturation RNase YbeY [Planctomycetales bacterium]
MSKIVVEINDQQADVCIASGQIESAVRTVLEGESIETAHLSVALVDDVTIWKINRDFLGHDYPTDVISFPLSGGPDCGRIPAQPLEGELVISGETAARGAVEYGWSAANELILYVIHGTLHLAGYDDHEEADRVAMRAREELYFAQLGRGRVPRRRLMGPASTSSPSSSPAYYDGGSSS